MEFITHKFNARKDLLYFVEENLDSRVYQKLGKNPRKWIDELNIINQILIGEPLVAGIDIFLPPEKDPQFKKLGRDVFLCRGEEGRLRGLWLSKYSKRYDYEKMEMVPYTSWTHYRLGDMATLRVNSDFSDVPIETFLPENFETKSRRIKDNKRPILCFDILNNKKLTVYAKGAYLNTRHLYEPPSYRLTNLSGLIRVTSKQEMDRFLKLGENGVKVPTILGYYEALTEEFLFLQKVEGKNPLAFLDSHREEIIKQDAKILANLCLLGYRKIGFSDFDDKIFDGNNLYLIDAEEFSDIYYLAAPNFRAILLGPSGEALRKFREMQKSVFITSLKDAIYNYRETLTPTLDDKVLYIKTFYDSLKWKEPGKNQIKELTIFPGDYQTIDSYISMMSDTD